jgi:hypothetical protein
MQWSMQHSMEFYRCRNEKRTPRDHEGAEPFWQTPRDEWFEKASASGSLCMTRAGSKARLNPSSRIRRADYYHEPIRLKLAEN